jgi:protein TonB
MELKKNHGIDLERHRGLIFLVALALSLFIVLNIFEINFAKIDPEPKAPKVEVTAGIDIPITVPETKQKSAPKKLNPDLRPKPVSTASPILKSMPKPNPQIDLGGLEPIDSEFDDESQVETVEMILVEHVARPAACADLKERESQMKCLNQWISTYLAENIRYPERERELGIEEKLYFEFVISETGQVEKIKLLRGSTPAFIEEAERCLQALPRMIPAQQMGREVRMRMRIPVSFKSS